MRFHRILILAIVVFSIAIACASREPCRGCEPDDDRDGRSTSLVQAYDRLRKCFAEGPASANVLLLSGGGSHGAWGAGVLNGWRDKPRFQVVTGVSTGALQATHAFLGRASDDARLREAYTTAETRHIYRSRFFLTLPFANSLNHTGPLRERIAEYIDDALIDEVASVGEAENRLLFVGTVDLDTGGFRTWERPSSFDPTVSASLSSDPVQSRRGRRTVPPPGAWNADSPS